VNGVKKFYRYTWSFAWYAFAAVVVLLAAGFAALRLMLPYADQYTSELTARFSAYLGQPVQVQKVDAEWHGWGPSLVLQNVTLLDTQGKRSVLQFASARLGFDLLGSLLQWQPQFSNITLVGVKLELRRDRDGRLSIAGLSQQAVSKDAAGETNGTEELAPVSAWLFSQGRLGLEKSDVTWRDDMGARRRMHFSDVNLLLRNSGDRHQLDASVLLPRSLGESLQMHVDMRGNPLQARERRTRLYLSGKRVRLAELLQSQTIDGVAVTAKAADFNVWGRWQDGRLQQLQGDVDVAGVSLLPAESKTVEAAVASTTQALVVQRVAGRFNWAQDSNGWRFDGKDLVLVRKGRHWQPARIAIDYAVDDAGSPTLRAAGSYLQLEDVASLMSVFAVGGQKFEQALAAVAPRGEIKDAQLRWYGGKQAQYTGYAKLTGATANAWRAVPAAKNVNGELWVDNHGGQVALQSAEVTLDFPKLFRWPLQVDELRGTVAWQVEGDYWRVSGRDLEAANADVSTWANLDVVHDSADKAPFMSLVAEFKDGDGSQVARYLPTGIMPVAAVDWLDKAIVSARIVSGGSIFHGRLNEFPFDRGNGRFEVRFAVQKASLDYAPSWPVINDIDAEVRFQGRGMWVDASHGKIFSNQIQWAKVGIEDMTRQPMLLTVNGEVQGDTQEKLDYLIASPPLYESFAQSLVGMKAQGQSLLHLDLGLPIGIGKGAVRETKVAGWVSLADNALTIPPLGQVLSQTSGKLEFFQDGLKADSINTHLMGQQTQLHIATSEDVLGRKARIAAKGVFNASAVAGQYLPVMKDLLSGEGEWDVSFDIPFGGEKSPQAGRRLARLRVSSNLKGVEARLPPPFDKKAEEEDRFQLQVDFHPQRAPVLGLDYAGFIDGVFELDSQAVAGIKRGEMRLGGGVVTLPEKPGLRVVGWLDTVSLDDWRTLWPDVPNEEEAAAASTRLLQSADVGVRQLVAYGQRLQNVRLRVAAVDDASDEGGARSALDVDIDSEQVKGRFAVPHNLRSQPLSIDLAKCYLGEVELGEGAIDPRQIPNLDLRIADFRYKTRQLGKVHLETTRVADGLRIEQLVVEPHATTMTARGGWYVQGDKQRSNIQMHVDSHNIGRTLKALDYVGAIDGGKGVVNLELKWPGSFAAVNAGNIQGNLNMRLTDGHLLEVDPGAGRMFGMLSIQTLPRRLLLDFSDVFKKGFGFDVIKGNFTIDSGDAYTNNLYMDGPAARVDIAGRVGLVRQDYDQLVTVVPHVAESLPLIGALTAAPQVGAAILFVQKLFKPQIDVAAQNQYTISGDWNNPVIKKVKKAPVAAKSDDDDL
jgi:uncharacterized protein (TIGR02099 family)